jgi:hypothetical protein
MPTAYFTKENARQMQAKGILLRKQRMDAICNTVKTLVDDPSTDYQKVRLARVRAQLARVDEMIDEETDPKLLNQLAQAQDRLAEQERKLAGRPLPGSHRPRQAGQTLPVAGAWLDDVPAQVVAQVVPVAQPEPKPDCIPDAQPTPPQVVVVPVEIDAQKPQCS